MKIKEVENLLSVSRSNIRFYEKEGLLSPEREENNYRDYSEHDVAELKKILVLRKLGFTVEEISSMQKGRLSLTDAASDNISRLEKEIECLKGALEITKSLSAEESTFEALEQDRLWDEITQSESDGQEFADICKDYLLFELNMFDSMWKNIFFHNFKRSREKHGVPISCGILLLMCLIRGVSKVLIWHESFWSGFLYPVVLFVFGSIIILPVYILSKRLPRVAYVICIIFLTLGFAVLALCVLAILYGVIRTVISYIS